MANRGTVLDCTVGGVRGDLDAAHGCDSGDVGRWLVCQWWETKFLGLVVQIVLDIEKFSFSNWRFSWLGGCLRGFEWRVYGL
jgi:hypothetical protein